MGSKGRLLFDLNEPPADHEDDNDGVFCFQPQRAIPSSSTTTSDLFVASAAAPQGIVNNHAFSHASSVSGFQPFVRPQIVQGTDLLLEERSSGNMSNNFSLSSKPSDGQDVKANLHLQSSSAEALAVEKEEGEWSDAEGAVDTDRKIVIPEESSSGSCKYLQEKGNVDMMESDDPLGGGKMSHNADDAKNENIRPALELDPETIHKKGDISTDGQEGSAPEPKQREIKGVEANHALKCANTLGKRPKLDQQKEAMLGKKRNRQTMFLNLEDVKQAGALKTSTPRRQIPAPTIMRTMKEGRATVPSAEHGDKLFQPLNRDTKPGDLSSDGANSLIESNDCKFETNGDNSSGSFIRPRRLNSSTDLAAEGQALTVSRQGSWKQSTDTRNLKNSQVPGKKPAASSQSFNGPKLAAKKLPSKKLPVISTQYQDTSVERLLREVTNEKFWHNPEEEELQRVPGHFESVEEYIRVFEPLLFEECRAQLYSAWEESSETASTHVRVNIKSIERRERGIILFSKTLRRTISGHQTLYFSN